MRQPAVREEHYGVSVLVNPTLEALRRTECLCLHCTRIPGCVQAAEFYRLCQLFNTALAVTRCPTFIPRG